MSATTVRFFDHERSCSLQREAYEWELNSFIRKRPDIIEDQRKLDYISQGYGRRFLDRDWKNLWDKSRHLAAEGHGRHYIKLLGGWYANINLSEDVKLGVLRRFAEIAGFKEGTDWSWITGERRTRPAAARLARDLRRAPEVRPDFVVPELDLESV
jgi:hypothetical protein